MAEELFLKYNIMKTNKKTGEQEFTGLIYQCQRKEDGYVENGDDALIFAKKLGVLYDDGHSYDVTVAGY